MKLGSLVLAAATLGGGALLYKYYQDKGKGEPLEPQTPDDYIVDEWVRALPQSQSARLQIWQNTQEGHFYGRWAKFGPDGEEVLDHGPTKNRPGIDRVRQDLVLLFTPSVTAAF